MKEFKGRVVTPGEVTAEAVVTREGFNTLASLQMALQFGDKEVKCGDQSNKDLYGKPACYRRCNSPAAEIFFNVDSYLPHGVAVGRASCQANKLTVTICPNTKNVKLFSRLAQGVAPFSRIKPLEIILLQKPCFKLTGQGT